MLSFDTVTAAELAACTTKTAWCAALIAALGSSRTVTGKRAAAGDAWAGVTFIDAPLAGPMSTSNGAVSSLGAVGVATTQQAADLSTGVAVLRIAGGSRWVQGTIGLAGSGADFILPGNPSATKGFGFRSTTKLRPPANLPMGSGVLPPPDGADRASQSRLFQNVAQLNRPSSLGGGGFDASGEWGPTYSHVDFATGWTWTNPGGDWVDAAGVAQGNTPFASFTANAVSGQNAANLYTNIDVTALLQYVQVRGLPAAFHFRRFSGTGPRHIAGLFGTYAAPTIAVTYSDSSTATLACLLIATNDNSASNNMAGDYLSSSSFWEFERPAKQVSSAVLSHVAVTRHWSGSATMGFFVSNPPKNAQPVTGTDGLASSAGALDDGLHAVPGILGVQRYVDGTALGDFGVGSGFNKYMESAYSPELWGGAVDTTKLPHALIGTTPNVATAKFLSLMSQGNVSLVNSSYSGDGFEPLAPGLGALRIHIPDNGTPTGGVSGYAGGTGADATVYLPAEKSGLVERIFVRAYYRLAAPTNATPADRREYWRRNEAGDLVSPVWADLGGKWGVTPYHIYAQKLGNGVAYPNSGGSGGPYGYQLRYGWKLCDEGNGGPDCGGMTPGWHLYDFQRNPSGYKYDGAKGHLTQWGRDGGFGGVIYAGRWYCVETEVQLNSVGTENPATPGQFWSADGVLRTWINGRLVFERTDLVFRTLPKAEWTPDPGYLRPHRNLGVQALWLNHFHGGVTDNSCPTTWFMTGLAYGEQRIGPMVAPAAEYPWAASVPDNQWVELPMTRHYDWAAGPNGIAQSGYRGSSPLVNTLNAFCDPATDQDTGDQFFFGGGHGDSSCNAVYANRAASLEWEVVEPATPPSVYLPGYMVGGGKIGYPSGAEFNNRPHEFASYFKTIADGLDPVADAGYIASKRARASTHMYQAAVYRKSADGTKRQLHYFYKGYSVYDLVAQEWGGFEVNLEAQLALYKRVNGVWKIPGPGETGDGASLGSSNEIWGISAIHDPGTDRGYFLVTGGGYRNHIAQINYDTRLIESVYVMTGVTATNASFFCRAGRKLYVFANEGTYPTYTARRGYIFDLDTKAMRRFDTGGETMPQILGSKSQETIPGWYDSNRGIICRWNYGVSLTTIHTLNLTPASGSGTHADPDILMQSTREVSIAGGDFPGPTNKVSYAFGRISFIPAADCVRLILRSETTGGTGRYWALRLT